MLFRTVDFEKIILKLHDTLCRKFLRDLEASVLRSTKWGQGVLVDHDFLPIMWKSYTEQEEEEQEEDN